MTLVNINIKCKVDLNIIKVEKFMIGKIAKVFFGSANDRFIKKQYKTINKINALEPQTVKLGDEELKAKRRSSASA